MSLLKEITRIKNLMLIKEEKNKTNLFDDFDLSEFKKTFDKQKGHSELTFQMTQDMNNQKYIKDLILI